MPVKESSDELNPPAIVSAPIASAPVRRTHTAKDYIALAVATCGVGYLPLAPGTWGSIVGVGVYLLFQSLRVKFFLAYGDGHWFPAAVVALWTAFTLVLLFCVTIVGVWAATHVERTSGRKDPGKVVIDEVAGQLITLLAVPYFIWSNWPIIVAGFLLFRAFDIWKPYPIRRLEALPSGLGIMADDVLAGAYAAIVLSALVPIYLLVS